MPITAYPTDPDTAMTVHRRILGIDYGTKRIGIAVSDPLRIIAKGCATVANDARVMERIRPFITEFDPGSIVVGCPLNLRGDSAASEEGAGQFARDLENEFHLPVDRFDERFTSVRAHQTLLEMGVPKKGRRSKEIIDTMAAALILQGYLDRLAGTARTGEKGRPADELS